MPKINVLSKRCNKCGEVKPIDRFDENKLCKDGHTTVCKDCRNAREKERRAALMSVRKRKVPELSEFTDVQLVNELKSRGWKGKITHIQEIKL